MVDARENYIASLAPRRKRTHPARSAQALNTRGAGIVHRNMMDLQRQPNLNKADTARLKDLRRDWNRNRKYTDAGMAIAGASNQLDAQKYFRDTTEDFRQTNKPAYSKMYPLSSHASSNRSILLNVPINLLINSCLPPIYFVSAHPYGMTFSPFHPSSFAFSVLLI